MYIICSWAVAPINILSIRELSPHLGLANIQVIIGFNYRNRGTASAGMQDKTEKGLERQDRV